MPRDASALLDQLFPNAPPHEKQTRLKAGPGHVFTEEERYVEGKKPREAPPTRWAAICTLELRGVSHANIANALGMSVGGVSNIVNDRRYIAYREQRLADLDADFVAMKPLAFAALRGGLQSADENTALRASEQWFRGAGFGGFSKTEQPSRAVTAEDVAARLLQVNVQVNMPGDTTTHSTTIVTPSRDE